MASSGITYNFLQDHLCREPFIFSQLSLMPQTDDNDLQNLRPQPNFGGSRSRSMDIFYFGCAIDFNVSFITDCSSIQPEI